MFCLHTHNKQASKTYRITARNSPYWKSKQPDSQSQTHLHCNYLATKHLRIKVGMESF